MSETGSVTEPPPVPPFPPDAQAVMWMRQAAGRPPMQPLIMFLNQDRTLCYSNAGTNFLLSPPALVEFEGVPRRFRQLRILEENRCCRPDCHIVTRTNNMRSCLSLSVVNPVTHQPFTTVMEAISYYMRDEDTDLRCKCKYNRSVQRKSISILPKVKFLLT